jgi:hypothetical protein
MIRRRRTRKEATLSVLRSGARRPAGVEADEDRDDRGGHVPVALYGPGEDATWTGELHERE